MKSKPLLITILILLIIAGSVWLYQSSHATKITAWNLIGEDAALVLELNRVGALGEKLEQIPNVLKIVRSSASLNELLGNTSFLRHKSYIALQPIASDDFEFLLLAETAGNQLDLMIKELKSGAMRGLSESKRIYNGIEIHEFNSNNKPKLSFAFVDDILVLSKSPFLVEGAVRLRNDPGKKIFRTENAGIYKLPSLQSDEGNIYINITHLYELLSLTLEKRNSSTKNIIAGAGLADLKILPNSVLVNGFVIGSGNDALSMFDGQKPQAIDIQSIVSNRVSSLVQFGFSDPEKWFENQQILIDSQNTKVQDSLRQEMRRLSVSVEAIQKSIGNQMASCKINDDHVILLKLSDKGGTTVFDELSSKIAANNNDSVYVENYAGLDIKLIDYEDFLHQLMYPIMPKSQQSYFVKFEQYLLFAENVELLKTFIDDIDSENTWGKSVEWNKFIDASLQESSINLFVDGKLTSIALKDDLNKKWRPWLDSTRLLGLSRGAFQLSRLEDNFYLNALIEFSEPTSANPPKRLERTTFDFGNSLITAAQPVRSHVSKGIELFIQDSLNNVYLLSKDLKVLWKQQLNNKLIDDIEEVDFYSNGKLQYLFTTRDQLYLVDRLGRSVESFPKKIATSNPLSYSKLVDYDKSKRYRYLLSDEKGTLYLTDKNGVILEGWEGLPLNGKLLSEPRHYRILGKDYFIAIQQHGTAHLFNRRGEAIKGFPLQLGIRPLGDFALTTGASIRSTYFTVVSDDGILLQFGLDGQILKREALLKKVTSSRFSLTYSEPEGSSVIMRIDPSTISILDTKGVLLFEIENRGSFNWQLSFIENRLKQRYYCLYDEQQDFSYFYDTQGNPVIHQPLESTQAPALFFNEKIKSLEIYNVNGSTLSSISINN